MAQAPQSTKEETKDNSTTKNATTTPDQATDMGEKNQVDDEYLLDMVFVLDCTGSMASYINSARDNIVKISKQLSNLTKKKETKNSRAKKKQKMKEMKKQEQTGPKQSSDKKNNDTTETNNSEVKNDSSGLVQIEGVADTPVVAVATDEIENKTIGEKGSDADHEEKETNKKNAKNEKQNDKAISNKEEKDEKTNENENDNDEKKEAADDNDIINGFGNNAGDPKKKLSCKFAVVAFRDHPPQDSSFITQIRSFTASSVMIEQYLATLTAKGGGDGPESLTTALYDTLYNLKYRENSQKIVILITDAPCHGIEDKEKTDDGFPDGDPWPMYKLASSNNNNNNKKGTKMKKPLFGVKTRCEESGIDEEYSKNSKKQMIDVLTLVREITDELQASFYTVACEPSISTRYDYARDFMEAVAEMSNGKYLPLASAKKLPKVIIGSVRQQMIIDELTEEIDKEVEILKKKYKLENKLNELTEDVIQEFMEKKWENANLTYKQVTIGTLYKKERKRNNIDFLLNRQECKTLKDFEKKRILLPRLTENDFRHLNTNNNNNNKRIRSRTPPKYGVKDKEDSLSRGGPLYKSSLITHMDGSVSNDLFVDEIDVNLPLGGGYRSVDTLERLRAFTPPLASRGGDGYDSMDSIGSHRSHRSQGSNLSVHSLESRGSVGTANSMGSGISVSERIGRRLSRSNSMSSQGVYEEIRPMDNAGVAQAVRRYLQTNKIVDTDDDSNDGGGDDDDDGGHISFAPDNDLGGPLPESEHKINDNKDETVAVGAKPARPEEPPAMGNDNVENNK